MQYIKYFLISFLFLFSCSQNIENSQFFHEEFFDIQGTLSKGYLSLIIENSKLNDIISISVDCSSTDDTYINLFQAEKYRLGDVITIKLSDEIERVSIIYEFTYEAESLLIGPSLLIDNTYME